MTCSEGEVGSTRGPVTSSLAPYLPLFLLLLLLPQVAMKKGEKMCHHSKVEFKKNFEYPEWLECSQVKEKTRNICNKFTQNGSERIQVAYYEVKPYTYNMDDKANANIHRHGGLLQWILELALGECCGRCVRWDVTIKKDNADLHKAQADIKFPVYIHGDKHSELTIPLIRLSGTVFIIKSAVKAIPFGKGVFTAIKDIWPLVGLSLLLAYVSGAIMWMLDTRVNVDHFPRSFWEGTFEGLWWAFISMTTVGYGDRAPKTVPAKLFAIFWILCGITIFSLLTAALTTAIDTVREQQRPSLQKGNLGYLRNHVFEKQILGRGNANLRIGNDTDYLMELLKEGEVDGILVDSFTVKNFPFEYLQNNKVYIDSVMEESVESYLSLAVSDPHLHTVLNNYIDNRREDITRFMENMDESENDIGTTGVEANVIYSMKSGIFKPMLIGAAGLMVSGILIGVTWELTRRKKNKVVTEMRSTFKVTPASLRQEEIRMEEELLELLQKWDKDLMEVLDNYSLQGMCTNSNQTRANVLIRLRTRDCTSGIILDKDEGNKPPVPMNTKTNKENFQTANVSKSQNKPTSKWKENATKSATTKKKKELEREEESFESKSHLSSARAEPPSTEEEEEDESYEEDTPPPVNKWQKTKSKGKEPPMSPKLPDSRRASELSLPAPDSRRASERSLAPVYERPMKPEKPLPPIRRQEPPASPYDTQIPYERLQQPAPGYDRYPPVPEYRAPPPLPEYRAPQPPRTLPTVPYERVPSAPYDRPPPEPNYRPPPQMEPYQMTERTPRGGYEGENAGGGGRGGGMEDPSASVEISGEALV